MTPIYERTIFGTTLMIFMLVMVAFIGSTMMMSDVQPGESKPWIALLTPLIFPILMGFMKVSVSTKELRLRFPFGFPRRTVPIEEIDAFRVTRSWRETGFGISVKPSNGQYCISGPSGVSILLHNGRTLLIGTPDPERLVKAIEKARTRAGIEKR